MSNNGSLIPTENNPDPSSIRIILEGGKISPPSNLKIETDGQTLSWQPPTEADKETAYQITYTSATDVHTQSAKDAKTTVASDLKERRYSVAVRAVKNENFSGATNPLFITDGRIPKDIVTSLLVQPMGLALSNDGWLYISNFGGHTVMKARTNGKNEEVQTIITYSEPNHNFGTARGIAWSDGWIYVAFQQMVLRMPANGNEKDIVYIATNLNDPCGLALSNDGWLYITIPDDGKVVKVRADGSEHTTHNFATNLNHPYDLALSNDGWLYITIPDDGKVVKVRADGSEHTTHDVITDLNRPYGLALSNDGWLYITSPGDGKVVRVRADGSEHTTHDVITDLNRPYGLALSNDGWLYITSFDQKVVRLRGGEDWVEAGSV
ncbi:fibronectin type III domain-containing protein [Streptomyces luteireticuli]|uniref:virginiamycin B lyase family protein n=1 Tax=Streptomyces luteireticuli TaxID=173858 RepID=UPI0035593275